MAETYLIESVGEPRPWSNDYGDFLAYPLTLKDVAGAKEWSRKSSSRVPSPGERVIGDISGDKIKVDLNATKELSGGSGGGSHSRGSNGSRSSGGWEPESKRDPEKVARIGRAHAQFMAVQTLTAMGTFESKSAAQLFSTLKEWIDWFETDVDEAAKKTAQQAGVASAGGSGAPVSPGVDPGPAQDQERQSAAEYLYHLLEGVGFNSAAATIVQRFIEETFTDETRAAAEAALRDSERVQSAVQKLTAGAEKHYGEPLPVAAADSDIPF